MAQLKPHVACGNIDDLIPLKFRGSWSLRFFDAGACCFALAFICSAPVHAQASLTFYFTLSLAFILSSAALRRLSTADFRSCVVLSAFVFLISCSFSGLLLNLLWASGLATVAACCVFLAGMYLFVRECGIEVLVDQHGISKRQHFLPSVAVYIARNEIQEIKIKENLGGADVTVLGAGRQISISTPHMVQESLYLRKRLGESWASAIGRVFFDRNSEICWADILAKALGGEILKRLEQKFRRDGYLQMGPLNILCDRVVIDIGGGQPVRLPIASIVAVQLNGDKLGIFTEAQTVFVKSDFANSAYVGIVLGLKPAAPGVYVHSDEFHCYCCEEFPMRFRSFQSGRTKVVAA